MVKTAYSGRLAERNLGVFDLPIRLTEPNPFNERYTWDERQLIALVESIRLTGGNVTPGIAELMNPPDGKITSEMLEEILADTETEAIFRMLGGNRRNASLRLLEIPKMRSRVLVHLDDEERYEIQFIENATKTKIPPHQIADSIWDLYLYRAALESGLRSVKAIQQFSYPDYDSVPDKVKDVLSLGGFANAVYKSESIVRTAFNYQKLHHSIREEVEGGKLAYSVAAQFGRIPNKYMQMSMLAKATDTARGRLSVKFSQKFVTLYLKSLQETPQDLELVAERERPNHYKGLNRKVSEYSRLLKKILYVIEEDTSILKEKGHLTGETLENLLDETRKRTDELKQAHADNPAYQAAMKYSWERERKGKPLIQKVLAGEFRIEQDDKVIVGLDLGKAEYISFVDMDDIEPCRTQVRKTFDNKKVRDMARTIERYGILQTIIVRPKNSKYEIVVGETRWRAAKQAGVDGIDVLVCPMDDITAQIVRIEEDLYEEVDLGERAEKLYDLYERRKEVLYEKEISDRFRKDLTIDEFEKEYTLEKFAKDLKIGTHTLRDAIKYASMESGLKDLLIGGHIKYSHLVAVADVQNNDPKKQYEQRRQYALSSIILGLNLTELKDRVRHDLSQDSLFAENYAARVKSLQKKAVDLVSSTKNVMYESVRVYDGGKTLGDVTDFSLLDNITRKENFIYLCDLIRTVDRIYDKIAG